MKSIASLLCLFLLAHSLPAANPSSSNPASSAITNSPPPAGLVELRKQLSEKLAAARKPVEERYKADLEQKMNSAARFSDLKLAEAYKTELDALANDRVHAGEKTRPEISGVRGDFLRHRDEAILPHTTWYVGELQKEIRKLTAASDVTGAMQLNAELDHYMKDGAKSGGFFLALASWGAGAKQADVTKTLRAKSTNTGLPLVTHWGFPDSAPFQHKILHVEYYWLGEFRTKDFPENGLLQLP